GGSTSACGGSPARQNLRRGSGHRQRVARALTGQSECQEKTPRVTPCGFRFRRAVLLPGPEVVRRRHLKGEEKMAATGKKPTTHGAQRKAKLSRKDYEQQLAKLHVELVKLQEWVKEKGRKVCVVFEGRDGAGKGGTIKAITERVSPRVFRVVALPAPSDREKSQMYMQRYVPHFPAAGEIVIFDRSWYNRAGVEYVMEFCTKEEHRDFLERCPIVEKYIVAHGIHLIKYWLEVSNEEQARRFEARLDDPLRQWKLSPVDLPSRSRWYDYSRA